MQDWSNTGLITANDDWSQRAEHRRLSRRRLTDHDTGADPRTPDRRRRGGHAIDVIANQTNPNTNTSGGVAEFQIANPTVALQGSGTADAPSLVFYLDATGRENVVFSFNARDIDGSADNAVQQVAVQYRIGDSGAVDQPPRRLYRRRDHRPGLATQSTAGQRHPAADVNGQGQVQVRVITTNAVGNDEWVGIDDIRRHQPARRDRPGRSSTARSSIGDASIVEGDDGIVAAWCSPSPAPAAPTARSRRPTRSTSTAPPTPPTSPPPTLTGTVSFAAGQTSATILVPIAGDTAIEANETFTVTLSAPHRRRDDRHRDRAPARSSTTTSRPPPTSSSTRFNYDPAGADAGEFIEIAGLAGTDLTGWSARALQRQWRRGPTRRSRLSGVIADTANGFGFVALARPADGIQNGAPDGIALVDNFGRVIQFLSYEGTMTATTGPAAGHDQHRHRRRAASTPRSAPRSSSSAPARAMPTSAGPQAAPAPAGGANTGQAFRSGTDTGEMRIDDARVVEGTGGTSALTFTVHRAGGFASAASVDYAIAFDGTADAADLVAGTAAGRARSPSPRANIAARSASRSRPTRSASATRRFAVTLGATSGNVAIVDGVALGTILNDDRIALTIMEIQGAGHVSDYVGQPVLDHGHRHRGRYQRLLPPGRDRRRRSRAPRTRVFVFTGTAPAVAVGDARQRVGHGRRIRRRAPACRSPRSDRRPRPSSVERQRLARTRC